MLPRPTLWRNLPPSLKLSLSQNLRLRSVDDEDYEDDDHDEEEEEEDVDEPNEQPEIEPESEPEAC